MGTHPVVVQHRHCKALARSRSRRGETMKCKKIILHQLNGALVTYTNCELLERSQGWIRFHGQNDMGNWVMLSTSLRSEIYES
jgi:hypothetical protein